MSLRQLSVAVGGRRIAWAVETPKAAQVHTNPLLLVHGFACGRGDWGALPRVLAARSRRPVVVFDNLGIGESDAPEGAYSVDEMASDALGVMDAFGAPVFGVLGISMGGLIAQSLTLAHPERVSALLLGCTSHGGREAAPNPPSFIETCTSWASFENPNNSELVDEFMRYTLPMPTTTPCGSGPVVDPDFFRKFKESFCETRRTSAGLQGQLAAMMHFNSTKRLHEIACPCLVITGDLDGVVPMANAHSLVRRIPGAQLLVLEGAGHFWWAKRTVDVGQRLAEALLESDEQHASRSKL